MAVPKAQLNQNWRGAFCAIFVALSLASITTACSLPKGIGLGGGPSGEDSRSSSSTTGMTITVAGGNSQTAVVGNDFNGYLVAYVRTAQGEPASGVAVNWSVVSGSASILQSSSSSINLDGTSAVNVSAGTVSGPIVVKAQIDGTSTSTNFTITAVSDVPATISVSSGNSQTGVVGTTLSSPLVAIVRDQYGNAVPNKVINWAVTAQGGSLSAASSTTGAAGTASTSLTLGTLIGTAGVSATVNGTAISTSFSATAIAAAPNSIEISSGDNQSAPRGSTLTNPLVVLVKDSYGNVCSGRTINWAVTAGGGSFGSATSTTNSSGLASASWTLGTPRGTNTSTATVNGTALSVTFTATGNAIAFTQSWPFDQAAAATNYTFDSTKIEFLGGTAKLKYIDQTDNDSTSLGFGGGTFSGVLWDSVNNELKLGNFGGCNGATTNCAAVGGSTLSGTFTSRVIDVGASATSAAWQSITWQTAYPFGKELPNAAASETATEYPSIGGGLMSGNIALWHFNDTAANSAPGGLDVVDSSGNGNHGTETTTISYGQPGPLNTSLYFNGTSRVSFQNISLPNAASARTVSLWFNKSGAGDQGLFAYGSALTADRVFELAIVGGSLIFTSNGSDTTAWSVPVSNGVWHLATATYDGTNVRLYLDGVLYVTQAFTLNTATNTRRIADGLVNTSGFVGYIDEVAMWNRQLSDTEVGEIYRRGASNLRVQVRSCALSDCSDGTFVGSGGTGTTYFSEINNSAITRPAMTFSTFGVTLTNRQYFQYRVIFDALHNNAAQGPTLKSAIAGPDHYDGTNPTIVNILTVDYLTLATFTETLGASGCSAGTRYALSRNGTNWYYWNGAAWAASNSTYAQASSAATINTNISTLPATAGIGNLYWKLFLKSDGAQQCEITNLSVTGTN